MITQKKRRENQRELKRKIDLEKCVIPSGRSIEEIDDYMRELRDDREDVRLYDTNTESKNPFARLEQLRRKGTVTDDKSELASYREEKYGK